MFSILKHTHDPTGVEHSLYCNFYQPYEKNLIVAGGHVLKVYRLISDQDGNKLDGEFVMVLILKIFL